MIIWLAWYFAFSLLLVGMVHWVMPGRGFCKWCDKKWTYRPSFTICPKTPGLVDGANCTCSDMNGVTVIMEVQPDNHCWLWWPDKDDWHIPDGMCSGDDHVRWRVHAIMNNWGKIACYISIQSWISGVLSHEIQYCIGETFDSDCYKTVLVDKDASYSIIESGTNLCPQTFSNMSVEWNT